MNMESTNNRRSLAAVIYAALAGFVPSRVIKKTG
jgi:hypothetical protein